MCDNGMRHCLLKSLCRLLSSNVSVMTIVSAPFKDGLGIATDYSHCFGHFTVSGYLDLLVVLCMRLSYGLYLWIVMCFEEKHNIKSSLYLLHHIVVSNSSLHSESVLTL